uniref:non-specific serine/threonine protein kinase n=1 Tax=Oryza meridionalis TaxID=40149 RepID=A0A0E0E2U5_9ORYZ
MSNTCLLAVLVGGVLLLLGGEGSSQLAVGDRHTLVAIRKGWGNPRHLASWDPAAAAADHCSWEGVTCSSNATTGGGGVVTELSLHDMNLTGTVPAAVCDLASLTRLDLSNNQLTGAFPAAALCRCSRLRFLDLANNALHGAHTRDIGRLSPAMEHLNLSSNRFSGAVPLAVAALPALRSLLLDTNRFTGVYPAAEIGKLAGLECLTLAVNAFAPAPVPVAFAKLTKLIYFWMSEMNIIGEIPKALSSLTELTQLDLSSNNLTGAIPAWVWRHEKLEYLYLNNNTLIGELPRTVTAVNLIEIDLSTNQLRGEMSEDFDNLRNLTFLSLNRNNLSGELPPDLGKHSPLSSIDISRTVISPNIQWIEMGNNKFSGSIPRTAIKLLVFSAENNQLDGELPADMSKLANLIELKVPDNRITGPIPASIKLLLNLKSLNLSGNQLIGAIS